MYDAIIVGARCAGAPTAMLLARQGYRVLLLDRDRFPSDTMSTHLLHLFAVARLVRWGLLPAVIDAGTPALPRLGIRSATLELEGSPAPLDGAAMMYAPRRFVLDPILVQAAVEAGAEFRDGVTVRGIEASEGRVTGIRLRGKGGREVTETARIVIGADGAHSVVARATQPEEYDVVPSLACAYLTYFSGVDSQDVARRHDTSDRLMFEFPTNDGMTCVAFMAPESEFGRIKQDVESNFWDTASRFPEFEARLRAGHREERFTGQGSVPNFFRKPYGAGWALVGDAGYHKDPVTGHGIGDAFRGAEFLAEAVDAGFSGREPLEDALAGYEAKRNAAARPYYHWTLGQVAFTPQDERTAALFRAVAADPGHTRDFLGIIAGAVTPEQFLTPENLGRILGAPPAAAPAS